MNRDSIIKLINESNLDFSNIEVQMPNGMWEKSSVKNIIDLFMNIAEGVEYRIIELTKEN